MKRRKLQAAAVLTIYGPGRMHLRGRKDIAAWLRRLAVDLQGYGYRMTKSRFTARYMY